MNTITVLKFQCIYPEKLEEDHKETMAGIVGMISPLQKEDIGTYIENMIRPVMHKKQYKVEKTIIENAGIAHISLDNKRSISVDDHIVLSITGEIFDQDALMAMLAGCGEYKALSTTSDILLKIYRQFGIQPLCGLNGLYLLSIWDSKSKKLTVINDRYGFRKFYYWLSQDGFLFASEYKSFIWHPQFNKKINELAVADFLSVNYILDDRTLFEEIKLLPPASVMSYQDRQLIFQTYWDYEFSDHGGKTKTEDYYIDEYALRVKEAVKKRCKQNMCLLISGGLDSRTLAAVAEEHLKPYQVVSCTVGHDHSYDVRFGRRIANSLGYDHTRIKINPEYIQEYADKGIWKLEGFNCFAFWIFAVEPFLEENNRKFTMHGFLGDCISGAHFYPLLLEAKDSEQMLGLLYRNFFNIVFKDEELKALLKPNVYKNTAGESFASIKRRFYALDDDNLLHKCNYVDLHQRQRRYITFHIDALELFSEVLDPFTDNEFVDFMLGVPVEMKIGQGLYKKMIMKHLTKVAKIPITLTGLPMDASACYETSFRLWHRFYSRVLPRHTYGILGHNYKHFIHEEWLRKALRTFVISTLSQKEYLEDYFNIDVVNALVAGHMSGKRNAYMKICALLTFLLWRKQFCYR